MNGPHAGQTQASLDELGAIPMQDKQPWHHTGQHFRVLGRMVDEHVANVIGEDVTRDFPDDTLEVSAVPGISTSKWLVEPRGFEPLTC